MAGKGSAATLDALGGHEAGGGSAAFIGSGSCTFA